MRQRHSPCCRPAAADTDSRHSRADATARSPEAEAAIGAGELSKHAAAPDGAEEGTAPPDAWLELKRQKTREGNAFQFAGAVDRVEGEGRLLVPRKVKMDVEMPVEV